MLRASADRSALARKGWWAGKFHFPVWLVRGSVCSPWTGGRLERGSAIVAGASGTGNLLRTMKNLVRIQLESGSRGWLGLFLLLCVLLPGTGVNSVECFADDLGSGPPVIVVQPQNQLAVVGGTATFSVVATGASPLSYEWRSYANSTQFTNVPGADQPVLELHDVRPTSRRMRVRVSNSLGAVDSSFATLTVTDPPPTLVSASSLNGEEIGIAFSRGVDATTLETAANYRVQDGGGITLVSSVFAWPGGTAAVLHLERPVADRFTVSAGVRDTAGMLIVASSVVGRVWAPGMQGVDIGAPPLTSHLLSTRPGKLEMLGSGFLGSGVVDGHFLHATRTNDFDVQVRVMSISKPTPAGSSGVDSPLVAQACLMVNSPAPAAGPSLTLAAMPTNGSRMFFFRLWERSTNLLAGYSQYTWGAAAPDYPIWLRIRRAGDLFRTYFSTNGGEWTMAGEPVAMSAPAVMDVGLTTIPFTASVYARAEFQDFGDTILNPGAIIRVERSPADVLVEDGGRAAFDAEVVVTGLRAEDLFLQWQAETAPGSAVFTNVPLASSRRWVTGPLTVADSGRRVRLQAWVSGGSPVISAAAGVTVSPDRTSPRLLAAEVDTRPGVLLVRFSEPIDPAAAVDLANYLGSDFGVAGVELQPGGLGVLLSLSGPLDLEAPHELSVSEVTDLAGRVLSPNPAVVPITRPLPARGGALQELYSGLHQGGLPELRLLPGYPNHPDSQATVARLEGPVNIADEYGTRISGFLLPPVTGNYNFWMASDDNGEFWLSTDESPANRVLLCREPAWNTSRAFATLTRRNPTAPENRSSTAFPAGIPLEAGKAYYFEAISGEGDGADNLSVAWQPPGGVVPEDGAEPIPGVYLGYPRSVSPGSIRVQQQPTDVGVWIFGGGNGAPAGRPLVSWDFSRSDGGFTTAQSGNPLGPWTYDAVGGSWRAEGSPDLPPSEKLLTSPPVLVTTGGEVRLRFQHRYNFEVDGGATLDGGQVRISVNGGPFALVPGRAFSTNG